MRRSILSFCASWLLAVSVACSPTQAVAGLSEQPRFQALNQQLSEPFDSTWSIAQDQAGNMWFGGQNGLRRYDGHRVTHFRAGDGSNLAHSLVRSLFVDRTGTLWVGTQRGLQRYDPVTGSFVNVYLPPAVLGASAPRVRAIVGNARGIWWIDQGAGVYFRDASNGVILRVSLIDGPATLRDQALDAAGNLWIAMQGQIARVDASGGQVRYFPLPKAAANEGHDPSNVFSVRPSGEDLWIGTGAGVLHWTIAGEGVRPGPLLELDGAQAWRLLPGRDGDLWIGTDVGLVHRDRAGHLAEYRHDERDPRSLGDQRVAALYLDHRGTLWISPIAAGMYLLDTATGFRRHVRTGGGPGQLSSNKITDIRPAGKGRIWIGTMDAGLNLVDLADGTVHEFHHDPHRPNSLRSDQEIFFTMPDAEGRIWINTKDGIDRFEPRDASFHRVTPAAGFEQMLAHGLERDPRGTLWLAGNDGLRKIDPASGTIEKFPIAAQADGRFAPGLLGAMLMEADGTLWLTYSGGLARFDTASERCTLIDLPDLRGAVSYVTRVADGSYWIGVNSAIVHLVSANGRLRVTRRVELEDEIDAILEAADGGLWVSTDGGLARVDPATGVARRFFASDGLLDGSYRTGSGLRAEDGTLYFGGFSGGMTSFRPQDVRVPAPPEPVLTDVRLSEASLLHGPALEGARLSRADAVPRLLLPYEHSGLRLDFSAMLFAASGRTRYALQLVGLDQKETKGAAPFAGFGRLPPGDYLFKVRAAGPNGEPGATKTLLAIQVAPPWWLTWWFIVGIGLVLVLLGYTADRVRVRILLRRQDALRALVEDRTSKLSKALAELKAAQQSLVFREKMASVGTLTAGMAQEIHEPAKLVLASAQMLQQRVRSLTKLLAELAEGRPAVEQQLTPQVADVFEQSKVVIEGTRRIGALVKDLRTFSRLDLAESQTVDLQICLESTLRLVRPRYSEGIEFTTRWDTWALVECRVAQMNQVFINLIVNACEAIEARRLLEPTLQGRVEVRTFHHPDGYAVAIADNGCGVPEAIRERIFEPFFTTKHGGENSGLGLATSFAIIQDHGGRIEVTEQAGGGACFTIVLSASAMLDR